MTAMKEPMTSQPDTPLLLRVNEAATLLSLGRVKVYQLMNRGELEVVRIDGAVRVTRRSVERFIEERKRPLRM